MPLLAVLVLLAFIVSALGGPTRTPALHRRLTAPRPNGPPPPPTRRRVEVRINEYGELED